LNTFKSLFADLWPIAPYIGRWVLNAYTDIREIVARVTTPALRGEDNNSLAQACWQLTLVLLRYPLQFVLTIGSLLLNALGSFINNVFRLGSERNLNDHERQYLQPIFGDNLDYEVIKIQTGGVKEKLGISPQAVGVDIFMRKIWGNVIVNDDLSLTPAGLRLLGHEACHVWQYQHRGAGYIGDSLITQLFDALSRTMGVALSDGYDVLPALYAKLQYEQCNVEQQAVMAELIGVVYCNGTVRSGTLTCSAFNKATGFEIADDEFALIQSAHHKLSGLGQNKSPDN